MSKKTTRSKDAAQTAPGTKDRGVERAKREARKVIQQNIARIEQAEARAGGEQSGEPQQPGPDQNQPDQAEQPVAPAAPGASPTAAQTPAPAPAPKPAKRGAKAKEGAKAQPAAATPAKGGNAPKAEKPGKEPKPKRLSCIDAAAQVLATNKGPMSAKDMIAEMGVRKLWSSPNGKTPEASLYAAVIREIAAKGDAARFRKVDRGLFDTNIPAPSGGKGA